MARVAARPGTVHTVDMDATIPCTGVRSLSDGSARAHVLKIRHTAPWKARDGRTLDRRSDRRTDKRTGQNRCTHCMLVGGARPVSGTTGCGLLARKLRCCRLLARCRTGVSPTRLTPSRVTPTRMEPASAMPASTIVPRGRCPATAAWRVSEAGVGGQQFDDALPASTIQAHCARRACGRRSYLGASACLVLPRRDGSSPLPSPHRLDT